MIATSPLGRLRRLPHGAARTGLQCVNLLTDLPMGIIGFVTTVVGLALSIGLMPLFLIGAVVFRGSGFATRYLAAFERSRCRLLLDLDLPAPPAPRGWRAELRDSATWRMRGYLLLRLPLGVVTAAVMALAWALPLVLIPLPFYGHALPSGAADIGLVRLAGPGWLTATVVVGIALLVAAPFIVAALAALDAATARALLSAQSAATMAARVKTLEDSRAQVVDAAAAERRRIERDLHDGAQQSLVALAMNLGRARARLDTDPEAARAIIDEAHRDAKTALTELRDLTRGIHPAVLTDRGLDAALSGLASRCPIPVAVDVDLPGRCPPTVEAIAYFVVSEALTNIARHAQARSAAVAVRAAGRSLHLTVTDDGIGGADPARGTGLAGLAGRVAGVDGDFTLVSPAGGPTTIEVTLPCAS